MDHLFHSLPISEDNKKRKSKTKLEEVKVLKRDLRGWSKYIQNLYSVLVVEEGQLKLNYKENQLAH
jgi:hypothetical protein